MRAGTQLRPPARVTTPTPPYWNPPTPRSCGDPPPRGDDADLFAAGHRDGAHARRTRLPRPSLVQRSTQFGRAVRTREHDCSHLLVDGVRHRWNPLPNNKPSTRRSAPDADALRPRDKRRARQPPSVVWEPGMPRTEMGGGPPIRRGCSIAVSQCRASAQKVVVSLTRVNAGGRGRRRRRWARSKPRHEASFLEWLNVGEAATRDVVPRLSIASRAPVGSRAAFETPRRASRRRGRRPVLTRRSPRPWLEAASLGRA